LAAIHYRPEVTPPMPPPPDARVPHRDGVFRNAAHGPLPILLLALTVVAGAIDAVSILALGRVFVANMTGNVVFIGFAIAGAPGFSLGSSLVALVGFLAGAAVGGQLAARFHADRAHLLLVAGLIEVPLAAAALGIAAAGADLSAAGGRYSLSVLLAAAMGIQNASARRLAVPDMTTTVLTMTLTGIAADVRHGEWRKPPLRRRLLAVAAMLGGAIAGAELVLNHGATADLILVTAILTAVTVGTATVAARDHGTWRQGPAVA
jgi:uncharacterized membrane protein YoaK (UPF0700 family)